MINLKLSEYSPAKWKRRCEMLCFFNDREQVRDANLCGAKHISNSKCRKHVSSGALFKVLMAKNCTPLWRTQISKSKEKKQSQSPFDVEKLNASAARSAFGSQNVQIIPVLVHFFKFKWSVSNYSGSPSVRQFINQSFSLVGHWSGSRLSINYFSSSNNQFVTFWSIRQVARQLIRQSKNFIVRQEVNQSMILSASQSVRLFVKQKNSSMSQ